MIDKPWWLQYIEESPSPSGDKDEFTEEELLSIRNRIYSVLMNRVLEEAKEILANAE